MNDSFQLLRITSDFEHQLKEPQKHDSEPEKIEQASKEDPKKEEVEKLKIQFQNLLQQKQFLDQTLEALKRNSFDLQVKLATKSLETEEIQGVLARERELSTKMKKDWEEQVERLRQNLEGKEAQIALLTNKLQDQTALINKHANLRDSIVMTMGNNLKQKQETRLQQLEDLLKKEVQLNQTIFKSKTTIQELQAEVKRHKSKCFKIQVELSDLKQQSRQKDVQLSELRELVKKSKIKIREISQLEDAIKREYLDQLKKLGTEAQVVNRKQQIDKHLARMVASLGADCLKEVLRR